MARLEKNSLTRWENGKPVTYYKGDDVPDLKPGGDPDKPNVFLTREEGAKVPARTKTAKTSVSSRDSDQDTDTDSANEIGAVDIIQLLEGNVASVVAHVATVDQISVLEDILVAEGEGKNRSTVTSAINDRIKALEES